MPGVVDLPATFTTSQARRLGMHPRDLYRARDERRVVEVSRGVFRRADAPEASYPDLLAVAYRAPGAVVCLLSAAAAYDLTDELPQAVQPSRGARGVPGSSTRPSRCSSSTPRRSSWA